MFFFFLEYPPPTDISPLPPHPALPFPVRPPQLHLDPGSLLERPRKRRGLCRRERGVDDDRALPARALEQPLLAIRSAVKEDRVVLVRALRAGCRMPCSRARACDDESNGQLHLD